MRLPFFKVQVLTHEYFFKIQTTRQEMPMAIVGKPGRGAIWSNNYEKKPYRGRLGNTALPGSQRRDIIAQIK